MKILLVGEYSRLHNSLKEGLVQLGHEVFILGDGDNFKNYPVDFSIRQRWVNSNWLTRKIKVAVYKALGVDLQKWEAYFRFLSHKKALRGFDVVQFINSNALKSPLFLQKKQLQFLKKHNKKLFLCACGTDTPIVDYLLAGKMRQHILTPLLNNTLPKENFRFELGYVTPAYRNYFAFFEQQLDGIIPSDIDYYLPLKDHPKFKRMVPNPVNSDKLPRPMQLNDLNITIFLGINALSYRKKGIHFFKQALKRLKKKYPHKIDIKIVENVPYQEYVKTYRQAHIFLDMVYAYDQGYNALEAMAQGKVVFTGADKEFLDYYALQEDEVCINALPDVDYIVDKLSWLIENPSLIKSIGQNARSFIETHHDYKKIAEQYITVWNED